MKFCQNKLFLLALLFLPLQYLSAKNVEERIKQLSAEEQENLEFFFATAIKNDHLGHVLFFPSKPACLIGRFISVDQTLKDEQFFKGWKVWNENEQYFPHPNYVIHHEIVELLNGHSALHIYFINKKTLNNFLSKNERILKEIDEKIRIRSFPKDLEDDKLSPLFDSDHFLVGLLLGYGIESSKNFKDYRIDKNTHESSDNLKLILCARDGTTIKKSNSKDQNSHLTCVLKDKANVLPISFFGNPNSLEVQTLRQKYVEELEKIEEIYQKKDLLNVVLQALCQD